MKWMIPCCMIVCLFSTSVIGAPVNEGEDTKKVSTSTYRITWDVVPMGGEITSNSPNHRISATVGQTAVEGLSNTNYDMYSGFWNPRLIGIVTSVETEETLEIPKSYQLNQNYPNPFNPVTFIQYDLPKASRVTIDIYNLLGHRVRALVDETNEAGYHTVQWDGRDAFGREVGNGVFIYRIIAHSSEGESFVKSMKMLLVK